MNIFTDYMYEHRRMSLVWAGVLIPILVNVGFYTIYYLTVNMFSMFPEDRTNLFHLFFAYLEVGVIFCGVWSVVEGLKLRTFVVNQDEIRLYKNQVLKTTLPLNQLKRVNVLRFTTSTMEGYMTDTQKITFEPLNGKSIEVHAEGLFTWKFPRFDEFVEFLRGYCRTHGIEFRKQLKEYLADATQRVKDISEWDNLGMQK